MGRETRRRPCVVFMFVCAAGKWVLRMWLVMVVMVVVMVVVVCRVWSVECGV